MNRCPKCKSNNVQIRIYIPVSTYGSLPKPPVDFCFQCQFKSEESFSDIVRKQRDLKIKNILNGI